MTRSLRLAVAGLALAGAAPAAAQRSPAAAAVAQARAAGLVGERYDGFLGVVSEGDPQLRRQVASVNLLRRSLYADLSRSRGVSLQEVGITAACQLLGTVRVGERYFGTDDVWRVRAAGEAAPVPGYCR